MAKKKRKREVADTREFNRETFQLYKTYRKKKQAQVIANGMRRMKHRARVAKGATGWAVYWR